MAELEELLDDVVLRTPSAAQVRRRGDLRRARRRGTLVAAAVACVAGAAWMLAPGGGGHQERPAGPTPTVVKEPNPYQDGNVTALRDAHEIPLFERWAWSLGTSAPRRVALPQVGFDGVCPASEANEATHGRGNQERFTSEFVGKEDSRARHRLVTYESADAASAELSSLRRQIESCGLEWTGSGTGPRGGADSRYEGETAAGGAWMRVDIEFGARWVSVVEIQTVAKGA
ncbi:hypothetical protein [Streptomyces apocyni]|uniref:hypothetical protein n=1 Tax=Streptomyces apocyni TaxID=2654677 RepID=UPI0012EA3D78|nr:hypothetical protein [Streptomyces apocyni]